MLDDKLSILQVVGFQNSGKTTLIEKLCQLAEREGLKLGCFKHHGHGGHQIVLSKKKILIDIFRQVPMPQVWKEKVNFTFRCRTSR